MSWYRAHVFDQSNLPSLPCTPSMRTAGLIISCRRDQVYLPVPGTTDEYYRYDLEFDGAHYLWPTDCCGDQVTKTSRRCVYAWRRWLCHSGRMRRSG